MFRYWDGSAWSAVLSANPYAPPPAAQSWPSMSDPAQPGPVRSDPAQIGSGQGGLGLTDPRGGKSGVARSNGRGWLIAAAAIVVVLVVVLGFIVRGVVSNSGLFGGGTKGQGGNQVLCPDLDFQDPTEDPVRDGRVYGGRLSYPLLPAPWSAPSREVRVPYGFNVSSQEILVDGYESGGTRHGWVASVLVGELRAGDGFFSPEAGSEMVTTCIVGLFYGDAKVTRNDTVNKAMQVDGHDAWLIESQLSFKIPGLKVEGEWLAVLIVDTGEGEASIFYASIPNTTPQWEAPARAAMADLRVS